MRSKAFFALLLMMTAACGGGGGGDSTDGMVLEGTLFQGSDSDHARIAPKHSAGEPIGEVQICALGSCSTTDEAGRWGFLVEGDFAGGEVLLTVQGHGIDATTVVSIPAGTDDAELALVNRGGVVSADSIVVDGVEQEHVHADGEAGDHDHDA